MERSQSQPRDRLGKISLVTLALITAALYFGRDVLIPLALAILISFILTPSVQRLQKMRLGRVPAVLLVVILVFGADRRPGLDDGRADRRSSRRRCPRYEQNIRAKAGALHGGGTSTLDQAQADRRAPPGGARHRVAAGSGHAGGPPRGEVARRAHVRGAGAGHRRRAAGDAADGAADDAVPAARSAGHGRPGPHLRHLHADPARGPARPPPAPVRPGAAQRLDAGARRGGAAGQPLPADAEPDQRRHRRPPSGSGSSSSACRTPSCGGCSPRVLRFIPYLGPWIAASLPIADLARGLPRLGEAAADARRSSCSSS